MEVTIFLAKVFGFYLIAKSVAIFLHAKAFKKIINQFLKSRLMQVSVGAICVLVGIMYVLVHNDWSTLPLGMVSLVGWAILLKGLLFFWAPEEAEDLIKDFNEVEWLRVSSVVIYIIGAYLLGIGYGIV
jgi:uncharacterized protein YjeT (DUF2065 family)